MRREVVVVIRTLALVTALGLATSGCGNSEFNAVKSYKRFLESAKPSLQKMNRVRQELFQVDDPDEMLHKFRDDLLPEIKKLNELAAAHTTPDDTRQLTEIHTTLRNVLGNYASSTEKLVQRLEKAKDDKAREMALVSWGEDDQEFGAHMASLVEQLERYLDKLRK